MKIIPYANVHLLIAKPFYDYFPVCWPWRDFRQYEIMTNNLAWDFPQARAWYWYLTLTNNLVWDLVYSENAR